MPSQTKTPATVVNDSSFGSRGWLGLPSKVQVDDAQFACPSSGLAYNESMLLCKSTAFGFDEVPDEAESVSVTFRVKRKLGGSVAGGQIQDSAARLVLGGVIQADDFLTVGNWPTAQAFAEYTFTGLTPAQVKDSGFGFAISGKNVTPDQPEISSRALPYLGYIEAVATW